MPAHIALAPSAICRLSGDPTKIYSFTLSTSSTRRARWYDVAYECFGTSKCKYRHKQTSKLTATYACMCVDMCNAVHVNMLLLHMYLALWYLAANHPLSRCKWILCWISWPQSAPLTRQLCAVACRTPHVPSSLALPNTKLALVQCHHKFCVMIFISSWILHAFIAHTVMLNIMLHIPYMYICKCTRVKQNIHTYLFVCNESYIIILTYVCLLHATTLLNANAKHVLQWKYQLSATPYGRCRIQSSVYLFSPICVCVCACMLHYNVLQIWIP